MNEHDQFTADMEGRSLDEIEAAWNTPEDPFCLPALNANNDFNPADA